MLREKILLSIVVPVFNEEESLVESIRRFLELKKILPSNVEVELIFVDDGSSDDSLVILRNFARKHSFIKTISLSRNFGHQIAITAGIDMAMGDYVAVIDADLQDPPELIVEMYQIAIAGADVVYGKRRSRAGETMFKKVTAAAFYRILSYLCEMEIPSDTGDFRLITRRVVDAFKQMRERHRFVRGMIPWVGFKTVALEYDRAERFAGKSKYPLNKMIKFATNAILSFSSKPLSLSIRIGLTTICIGTFGALYMLYLKLFIGSPIPGLTAVLVTIIFFSGVQILLIGVIGEYIARIFEEVKGRPLYIVSESINI